VDPLGPPGQLGPAQLRAGQAREGQGRGVPVGQAETPFDPLGIQLEAVRLSQLGVGAAHGLPQPDQGAHGVEE
jgi:hypothetical protein